MASRWVVSRSGSPCSATVAEALDGVDVLIEYTSHVTVKANTLAAIDRGVAVVIGSSGLTGRGLRPDRCGRPGQGVGVISSGNFSLTAALAQAAAVLVARFLPSAEVIDYAGATKPDAPSGTSRELAGADRVRAGDRPRPARGRDRRRS